MATKFGRAPEFKTPVCRLSFGQGLFKARAATEGAKKRFGCTLIFDKGVDRSSLDNAVLQVLRDTWGEKGVTRAKEGLIKLPFLDGEGKEARNKSTGDVHPGMGGDVFFIRPGANEDRPPVVLYRSPLIRATEEEVYSGCYGYAVLNAFAWNNAQNGDGVSFGIMMFQKTREGERLGSGGPIDPSKYFEKIVDEGDAPAETKSGAGAAALFG